jgi:uncharacterized repeat protein (TIGR03803 family)
LLELPNGVFYGSTQVGGINNRGTLFRFSTAEPLSFSLSLSNKIPSFTISSVAGKTYQLQYKTNLTQAWSNIGSAQLATNSTLKLNDGAVTGQQRFYRVYQLP